MKRASEAPSVELEPKFSTVAKKCDISRRGSSLMNDLDLMELGRCVPPPLHGGVFRVVLRFDLRLNLWVAFHSAMSTWRSRVRLGLTGER
jgi:hypothetical protein